MSFSSIKVLGSQAAPDRVYYNATIVNNTIATAQPEDDPIVRFADTRQTPLIPDASKYNLSVEYFTLNGVTKSLPVLIPQIEPGAGINDTIYIFSLCVFDGTNYLVEDARIIWESENKANYTVIPTTASPSQDESDYYYCYSYNHFVYLANKAIHVAWLALKARATFGTECPFLEFDSSSGLFSLNQDANTCMTPVGIALPAPFSTTFTAVGNYQTGEYSFLGMNANLEGLFTNFNSTYYSAGVEWRNSGFDLPESVIDMGLTNLNQIIDPVTGDNSIGVLKGQQATTFFLIDPFTNTETTKSFVKLTQDFVSTGTLWSPIASFVLQTTQIPVRNEAQANPLKLGNANIGTQNSSSGSFQRVLIEIPINAVTSDIWRGWVLYEPLTPTLSSLEDSKEGITEVDLFLYWRNRLTNALIPLRLYNSGSVSLRIMFEKRSI